MVDDLRRRPISKYEPLPHSSPTYPNSSTFINEEEPIEEDSSENSPIPQKSPHLERKNLYPNIPDEEQSFKSGVSSKKTSSSSESSSPSKPGEKNVRDTSTCNVEAVKADNSYRNSFHYLSIFAVVILLLTCVALYHCMAPSVVEPATAMKIMQNLKDFKQPNLTLKVIKSSLQKILDSEDEPTCPAILLLVSSNDAEEITSCFARRLANLISSSYNGTLIHVDGQTLKINNPDETIKEIDDELEQSVSPEEINVLLMTNLDLIPGAVAIGLHKYSDHEHAVYKKLVIIMTISGKETLSETADSKQMDKVASNRLRNSWTDLHRDQLEALLSRITVSVSVIFNCDMPHVCME